MSARRVVGEELDRAEPIRKMHGDNRDEQHDDHGQGGERHESPKKDEQSADHLDENRSPSQKERERHADRVQDADEDVGTAREFGVAVLEEPVSDG